jgi:hypothetical protein
MTYREHMIKNAVAASTNVMHLSFFGPLTAIWVLKLVLPCRYAVFSLLHPHSALRSTWDSGILMLFVGLALVSYDATYLKATLLMCPCDRVASDLALVRSCNVNALDLSPVCRFYQSESHSILQILTKLWSQKGYISG